MANNGYVLWRQWEETCGRTHEKFGELGPHKRCMGGSVAKMVAPLLSPLDLICHVRSLLVPELPSVHPWYTVGAQLILVK